jgi:HK97 family phage prohead protease
MKPNIEVRFHHVSNIELRSGNNGTVDFTGYATSYEQPYEVGGGAERGGWSETIAAGAGKATLNLNPDVRLLVNHDGLPLARTRSGTLQLFEDRNGLGVHAPALDPANPLVQQVRSAMERGDVDEMSFAFRAIRQEWNDDYTERRITEFSLGIAGADVSIVTYPANPSTVAQLRSAAKIDELRSASPRHGMSLAYAKALAYRA